MEHVAHARASAAHAAKAVLDPSSAETYDYLPYFYSRVFEHAGSERKVAWVFYGAQPEGRGGGGRRRAAPEALRRVDRSLGRVLYISDWFPYDRVGVVNAVS